MIRRDFITTTGYASLLAMAFNGLAHARQLKNSQHLVATPEKRAEYLAKMLHQLCTNLGPHPSGSPEYEKAAMIIKKEMELALPIVELDQYFFEKWELIGNPEFYVGETLLETYPAHGCSPTPAGGISGILKKPDEGRIPYAVVAESSDEILAHVTVSSYGRAVPRHTGGKGLRPLPRFDIGKQDIHHLESAVKNRTPVHAYVQCRFIPDAPSWNIIGTLPGKSREEILFLAHADTVYSAPGANDNTASMITMLMLAHAFSGTKPNRTITFVATGNEEDGLLGAKNYAKRREDEGTLKNITFIVNFDSLTYGPDLQVYSKDEELKSLIVSIDRDLKVNGTPKLFDQDGYSLDAAPFRKSGARAVYINSRGYNKKTLHLWHRPEDIPEAVPVDCVEGSFLVFKEYIKRVQDL